MAKGLSNSEESADINNSPGLNKVHYSQTPPQSPTGSVESESRKPHLFVPLRPSLLSSSEKTGLSQSEINPVLRICSVNSAKLQVMVGKHGHVKVSLSHPSASLIKRS